MIPVITWTQESRNKLKTEVEQFFADDPEKTEELFLQSVARLKLLSAADWFIIRKHDKPPAVLSAVMSAACSLMLVEDTWENARNLVGSSVQNMKVNAVPFFPASLVNAMLSALCAEYSLRTRVLGYEALMKEPAGGGRVGMNSKSNSEVSNPWTGVVHHGS